MPSQTALQGQGLGLSELCLRSAQHWSEHWRAPFLVCVTHSRWRGPHWRQLARCKKVPKPRGSRPQETGRGCLVPRVGTPFLLLRFPICPNPIALTLLCGAVPFPPPWPWLSQSHLQATELRRGNISLHRPTWKRKEPADMASVGLWPAAYLHVDDRDDQLGLGKVAGHPIHRLRNIFQHQI